MSIGPNLEKESLGVSRFDRVRYAVKIATETYFREPGYYLFYGLLLAVSIGLLFSVSFPWQLWAVLGALAVSQYIWPKKLTDNKK